jgi:hypothetical protein
MVLIGAARAPHIPVQARSLDSTDRAEKKQLDRLVAQATDAAGSNDKRDAGTWLHKLSEHVDRGEALPECSSQDLADMAAYKAATVHLDVVHVERLVVVDALKVAGTPDRVSRYDGPGPDGEWISGNLITDLKTGSVDYGALKMAMQLAVYSRGQFYDPVQGTRTELPSVHQQWGLIVHLPVGSANCTVHWVDLSVGWAAAQLAQQVRRVRATRHLLRPFVPVDERKQSTVVAASDVNV